MAPMSVIGMFLNCYFMEKPLKVLLYVIAGLLVLWYLVIPLLMLFSVVLFR